ncbi:MAG: hypothetical protein HC858_03290 [Brachymonas sp.]|nr:hypothetical protein [Brachymonas sp.]
MIGSRREMAGQPHRQVQIKSFVIGHIREGRMQVVKIWLDSSLNCSWVTGDSIKK